MADKKDLQQLLCAVRDYFLFTDDDGRISVSDAIDGNLFDRICDAIAALEASRAALTEQKGGYCADCNRWGGEHAEGCQRRPERFHAPRAALPEPVACRFVDHTGDYVYSTAIYPGAELLYAAPEGK